MASRYEHMEDDDVNEMYGKTSASRLPEQQFDDPLMDASGKAPAGDDDEMLRPEPPAQIQSYPPYQSLPPAGSQYPPGSYMPPPAGLAYPPGPYMPPPPNYGYQTSNTTTVIVQQPGQPQIRPSRGWSSQLCECGRDWSICCCGLFCVCCLESEVAQDMGESCLLPCCVPGWLITLRTKMRLEENIPGSVMDDCCHVMCCGCCTLCQLAYEIKVVRQNHEAVMRPL